MWVWQKEWSVLTVADRKVAIALHHYLPPTLHFPWINRYLIQNEMHIHIFWREGGREGESYFGWSFDSEAFRISSKERHHLQKLACSVSRYWMVKTKRNSSASTQIEHRRLRVPKGCNLNLYSSSMSSHFLPHTKNHDESTSTASAPCSTEVHPNL